MKMIPLGRVVSFKGGGTPSRVMEEYWNGGIPWATVKDFNSGFVLNYTQENISELGLKESASNLIPRGTLIIPTRMGLGKAVISNIDVAINQDLKAVIPNTGDVDTQYLLWFFLANSKDIERMGKGATVKGITLDQLKEVKIPLPPLPIQKKIAAVLEKADELRRKREKQIKRLDDLLQATFLDMFGDPVTNPKGWPVKVLEEIVSNECPVSYGIVQPGDFVEDGVPVVRPVDLDNGVIQVSALKKIDPNISGKYPRSLLNGDELLLTVRGSIGAVYLTSNEFAGSNVTRGIVPLRFNERIANKEFVYCMFQTESFKGHLKKISKGATLVQLNINELRKVPIILPSVDKQKSFKDIFLSLTMSRSLLEKANAKIDNTFNSLMQRAFKGELGLR